MTFVLLITPVGGQIDDLSIINLEEWKYKKAEDWKDGRAEA